MTSWWNLGIASVERGLVPDVLTRRAIRRMCHGRLRDLRAASRSPPKPEAIPFQASLWTGPIALSPQSANAQHYELPPQFFQTVLGPRLKYSCCLWETDHASLTEAEEAALRVTCERAELADGQDVLELGCGWGSLSLWMAERYPRSRITAVSNSHLQRRFIEDSAACRGLGNLTVLTQDINDLANEAAPVATTRFDRVVSVEMFEHMRNYDRLLQRIASWLRPNGSLFVHIFCHRQYAYPFATDGAADWMGRHFFTGGMMPSADLLRQFRRRMKVARQWTWNGRHYQRTARAWLANLDQRRDALVDVLRSAYGPAAGRWFHRWRLFFLAVAELFGFAGGEEWFVSQYLMKPAVGAE